MEKKETVLKFELTLDEINFILAQVSKEPYSNVVALIEKIKQQAQLQLNPQPEFKQTEEVDD